MQLPVQTFAAIVEQMAATVQGTCAQLVDFSVGSVLRAILESCAAVALWLQWLILQVLSATRAATCQGQDLDSWMADFSFARLPGSHATGSVTLSRFTAGFATTVPVGTVVLTADGSLGFSVVSDPSNPAWNGTNEYSIAASIASVIVPVQATQSGSAGNVVAGAIALVAAPIEGVDTVTNGNALSGGGDAESDAALRSRFQLFINSRSLGTVGAIATAILGVQPGLRYSILENQSPAGGVLAGNFLVTADDGSGDPAPWLLSEVQAAVDAVRPVGSTYSVMGPLTTDVSVTATLETSNPVTHASVAAAAQVAIVQWIAGLPVGGTLAISKIDALAHATDPTVLSVMMTAINGAALDVTAAPNGVLLPANVVVS
jgi:uncharacterized phage protein gp47/JayE